MTEGLFFGIWIIVGLIFYILVKVARDLGELKYDDIQAIACVFWPLAVVILSLIGVCVVFHKVTSFISRNIALVIQKIFKKRFK